MKLKSIFFLTIFFVLIFSCKKEVVITEYRNLDSFTWKSASEIDRHSKYILNAHASEDKAVFISPYRIINKRNEQVNPYYALSSHTKKTDISDDYNLTYNQNGKWNNLGLSSEKYPNPNTLAYILDTLSPFSGVGGIFSSTNWTAIRTDQKQFLFQYYANSLETQNFGLVNFEEHQMFGPEITKFKKIELPKDAGWYHLSARSFYYKYFICFGPGLEIIDSNGTVLQKSGLPDETHFYDVVLKGDSLVAFSDQEIYYSIDEGVSWELITKNIPRNVYPVYMYNYYVLQNEIVMFQKDQLVHLQFHPSEIKLRPIVSDALIHNSITSLFVYQDTVYASTLSGTFKKAFSQFFDYVE